jgi:hypothetical protein
MTISQMSIPEAVLVAMLSGAFAFLGALMAQLATRKRTAAETAKLLAETEKIRVEAEKIRLDIEKQRQELKSETERILTTNQETRDEIVAEVEKFSRMADAQLSARYQERRLAVDEEAVHAKLETEKLRLAQVSALDFLTEIQRIFPQWSSEDIKVAVTLLQVLSS